MTAIDFDTLASTEQDRVLRWRTSALERAGFDVVQARTLARRQDVDVHVATDLLARGCPPELATRILL